MSFENTRIFKLMKNLETIKLNRFSKFIHSPYFNKNTKISQLFDQLHNDIRQGNAAPSKEELWQISGFEDEYNDLKFRKLCNDLVERYERFIAVEYMQEDKLLLSNLLVNAVKSSDNEELIEKHIQKASTVFERSPDHSSDYFLQKYLHDKTLQNLKSNYEKKEDIKNFINDASYQNLSTQLDAYYVIEKLRQAIDVITWSKQYKMSINIDLGMAQGLLNEERISSIVSVKVYWLIFQILTIDESKNLYYELKELARKEINSFPKVEQAEIFDALFSYCVRKGNEGSTEFQNEYMDLHEWGIQEEFILKNGVLSPTSFRNYVFAGLRLGEYKRVEEYIEKHINLLEGFRQENALSFNKARVAWYKKDFDNVLTYLNQVNYDDVWYNINSKIMLLASYYELDEIDPLYSLMDSYTAFLRREKSLDSKRKKRHFQFISYLKKIVNNPDNKNQMIQLKEEIIKDKEVTSKDWLLEKIDELT